MKRRWLIILALTVCLPLAAYELRLIPLLQVNVRDQVGYVLPSRGIMLTSYAEKVERYQPFHIEIPLIIAEKLAAPLKLSGTLTSTGPDGKKNAGFENTELFELPVGAKGVFFPKIAVMSYFTRTDKPGTHRLELTVSDGTAEQSVAVQIELVESISDLSDMSEREFDELVAWYYRSPKPHRLKIALTTFIEYIEPELIRRNGRDSYNPLATYKWFAEVFKLNPQFYRDLAELSYAVRPQNRLLLALIFAASGDEVIAEQREKIHPEVLRLINDPEVKTLLDTASVSEVWHLDMLMAEFLATGNFEPVLKIVGQLRQREKITVEDVRQRPGGIAGLSETDRELLKNGLLEQCAVWMLRSNIQQRHILLAYYLESILHRNQYPDRYAAEQIIAILTSENSK